MFSLNLRTGQKSLISTYVNKNGQTTYLNIINIWPEKGISFLVWGNKIFSSSNKSGKEEELVLQLDVNSLYLNADIISKGKFLIFKTKENIYAYDGIVLKTIYKEENPNRYPYKLAESDKYVYFSSYESVDIKTQKIFRIDKTTLEEKQISLNARLYYEEGKIISSKLYCIATEPIEGQQLWEIDDTDQQPLKEEIKKEVFADLPPNDCKSDVTNIVELKNEFLAYPNPTDSFLNIIIPEEFLKEEVIFRIYDILGHELNLFFQEPYFDQENRCFVINLENFKTGIYLLKAQNSLFSKTFKILKQ